jgi:AraC-like DNA-binding protein
MTSMSRSDEAWERWLQALQDPRLPFSVAILGMDLFDEWDVGRRTLPEHMLHYVFAGGQQGTVGGEPLRTAAGTLMLVPAGTPQELRRDPGEGKLGLFYFRFSLGPTAPRPPPLPFLRPGVPGAHALVLQIYHEHSTRLPGREQRLRALLALVFSEWWRASLRATPAFDLEQRRRVLELIDRRIASRLDAATLARELGMTPTWFARQFRRTFGLAPRTWLVRHRVHLAAQRLLAGPEPVGRIASAFGYADLFLFSRQFRQVMGMSPSAWRQQSEDRPRV